MIVIGANDGLSFDDLLQDIHPKLTKGVLIEPSSRYFNQLVNNIKDFPNLKAEKVAVANEESRITLYQLNNVGLKKMPDWGSGLGSFSKDHILKFGELSEVDIEEENVQGKTFQWLIHKFNCHSVDYLQIDTEGFDAEIIKMIDFDLFSAKIIKFEVSNISLNELIEVKSILSTQGYWLDRIGGDMVAYSKKVNPFFY